MRTHSAKGNTFIFEMYDKIVTFCTIISYKRVEETLKKLTINELIFLIAIWHLEDKAFGVKIREKIKELTGTSMMFGTIYNTLEYLVKKEYIAIRKESPKHGNEGKRVYYQITADGLKALKEARELQKTLWKGIPEYVLNGGESD
jgi:DNA-binding PadR family transcriptional regulator